VKLGQVRELLLNKTFSCLMIFCVLMNASQTATVSARNSVLSTWVDMSTLVYSLDQVLQYVIMMFTLAAAAKWFKAFSWRGLLIGGSLFYVGIMFLFWLVVLDIVRNQWLVIFIDADQTFAQNIGYLVVMWACVEMAPPGIEGTTLALATTVGNAGQSLGTYLTMAFNAVFAISREDIALDNDAVRRKYLYNSLAVMAVQCLYFSCLGLLPNQKEDAKRKFDLHNRSRCLAIVAVSLISVAIFWGVGTTLAALWCSCSPLLGGGGCDGSCHK
jgi:hypothetical protein